MFPILVLLALQMLGLGITLAKHGEEYKHNFGTSMIGFVIANGLLYWGGWFAPLFGV